jgi:hypothetical protein
VANIESSATTFRWTGCATEYFLLIHKATAACWLETLACRQVKVHVAWLK